MDSTSQNPFTPGFGQTPSVLAGRGRAIEDFARALAGDLPAGRRSVLVSGPRGSGKTVMLSELEAVAEDAGWKVVTLHTASVSLAEELRAEVVSGLRDVDPEAITSRVTGGGASGVSAQREVVDRYGDDPEPLAGLLRRYAALLADRGAGLLLTIDEIQSVDTEQLHILAQHVQDIGRRGLPVAFAAAGVSSGVEDLLQNDRTTFLRRAHPVPLGSVAVESAIETVRQTVADTDRTIAPDAAVLAGEASHGYPYLIQLIGALAWERAGEHRELELLDVEQAIPEAISGMVRNVHQPALRSMSGMKMEFLRAMAEDEGPTRVADIITRMGKDSPFVGVYRDRLRSDGMIRSAGHGLVEFALPYLREALMPSGDQEPENDGGVDVVRPRSRGRRQV